MLTMTNPLTIEGYTVYQDDGNQIAAALSASGDDPIPEAEQTNRFYILADKPTIAKDDTGAPIFSLVVYRRDEDLIAPGEQRDVGGGILTFTVEIAVDEKTMKRVRSRLATIVFGDDTLDNKEIELTYVPFLDGKVSVAVAGETGADAGQPQEFVSGIVGNGTVAGVGASRKAVMVKLTQAGAALMSQLEKLKTLPINVQYDLSYEHRLLGVTMRVWADINSSFLLDQTIQDVSQTRKAGYLSLGEETDWSKKINSVTETLHRNKTMGVTVIPATSQIDSETLLALEKMGLDMLNKEVEKALVAAPPPETIDRTYITSFEQNYFNNLNFTLDRRMVLVQRFTPSANVSNVFQEGRFEDMVAFVDLRTAFFRFLKVPIRVTADFTDLPVSSVTVTVTLKRARLGGGGLEEHSESFNFTSGDTVENFTAFANTLDDLDYDWSATVFYDGSDETYTISKKQDQREFLVIPVGTLGMLAVDFGIGLVDLKKFPTATVSFRYRSAALGRTIEKEFTLSSGQETGRWTEVIHEPWTKGIDYKVDWLKADGSVIVGTWAHTDADRLRFDAPVPDQLEVEVLCSGNFTDGEDQIAQIPVSLRYEDPANNYTEEGHLVFTDASQHLPWTIDLRNPQLRDYEYRYSIVYKGGVVNTFPPDDGWFDGEPGFITVGEKYSLQVDIYPMLLSYPDGAKVVQVDVTYDDPAGAVHHSDSFVFSAASSTARKWHVRGREDGPKQYAYKVTYFAANGQVTVLPPVTQESEAIVVPPLQVAPPPPPPSPPPPPPTPVPSPPPQPPTP